MTSDIAPIKVGYLHKVGGNVDSKKKKSARWQKRWFELTETTLQYFKAEKGEQRGIIQLNVVTGVAKADNVTGKSNSFALVTPPRTFYFQAEYENERDLWITALTSLLSQSKVTLKDSPPSIPKNQPEEIQKRDSIEKNEPLLEAVMANTTAKIIPETDKNILYPDRKFIITQFKIKEESLEEAKKIFKTMLQTSRTEKGCLQYEVLQTNKNIKWIIVEEWETEDYWKIHFQNLKETQDKLSDCQLIPAAALKCNVFE